MPVTDRTILASAIATIGLFGPGCSDADDPAEAEADTQSSQGSDVPAPDPDHPYCDIERGIDERFDAGHSTLHSDATEQQQLDTAQRTAQAIVAAGLLDEADAPDAIRADLDVLIAGVTAAADGDVLMLFTPETDQAVSRVDAFCGTTH